MKAVVTGGAGFIGCNLADRLARGGADVLVYDALRRPGVEANLEWLQGEHGRKIRHAKADVRDAASLKQAIRGADVVFHLAAQVAVTTSLVDPEEDFEVNVRGAVNVLEAARAQGAPVIFSSTNKVYGDLGDVPLEMAGQAYRPRDGLIRARGVDEDRPLSFHTPYGCSKGAADQYVLDYARSYDLPTCVFRMSCIYGPHQMGTEDQGWVAHFLIRALNDEPIVIYGDGRQVRDILFVDDAVDAYVAAYRSIDRVSGRAFNLGGGAANAVSLLQLLDYIETLIGAKPRLEFEPWRTGDQRYYVSDASAARQALGLPAPRAWRLGVAALAQWLQHQQAERPTRSRAAVAVS